MDSQILKNAIRKALTKTVPFILEDAIQYLDNHHSKLKQRKKKPKVPRRTESVKEYVYDATIPYFDESSEPEESYDCPSGVSGETPEEPYDCPPASWEDIGVWNEAPEEPQSSTVDAFRLEDIVSSSPTPLSGAPAELLNFVEPCDQSFSDSLYEEMD